LLDFLSNQIPVNNKIPKTNKQTNKNNKQANKQNKNKNKNKKLSIGKDISFVAH
jgi:hypothetical protein